MKAGRDFRFVGLGGMVSWSRNGSHWQAVDACFGNAVLTGLTYTDELGGLFIAATDDPGGLGRTIATSSDGAS